MILSAVPSNVRPQAKETQSRAVQAASIQTDRFEPSSNSSVMRAAILGAVIGGGGALPFALKGGNFGAAAGLISGFIAARAIAVSTLPAKSHIAIDTMALTGAVVGAWAGYQAIPAVGIAIAAVQAASMGLLGSLLVALKGADPN